MTTATETAIRLTAAEAGLLLGLVQSATGMEGVLHSGLRDPDEIEEVAYELLLYARLTRELQQYTPPTGQEVLKFLAESEREREEMLGGSCGDEHLVYQGQLAMLHIIRERIERQLARTEGAVRPDLPFLRWARLVSNQRPLACEASALPLSYAP
jgi:hypothetical protein